MVEKPVAKPRPGSIVDIVDNTGHWLAAGSTTAIRALPCACSPRTYEETLDESWFVRKVREAVSLRRDVLRLDETSDAWRVIHSEGDGISGLVVDRYGDLIVVEFFSAGAFRHREWIYAALREAFPLPLLQLCRGARAEAGELRLPLADHRRPA